MTMRIPSTLFIFLLFSEAFAASASGVHGIFDQIAWPVVNVILLFSFLAMVIYKKGKTYFENNATQIEELYNYAQDKDRKAQVQVDSFKQKLDHFDEKSRDIFRKAEEEGKQFEQNQKKETIRLLERMRKDADDRIAFEKKAMAQNINAILIGQVVEKAKANIRDNPQNQKKVTSHLVSQMGL